MPYILKAASSCVKPGLQWLLFTKVVTETAPPRISAYLYSSSDGGLVLSEVFFAAASSFNDGLFRKKGQNLIVHIFLSPIHQGVGVSFLRQNLQHR